MSEGEAPGPGPTPMTVYCPQCGGPMLVAPEHARTAVACPHCQHALEPWRVMATVAGRHADGGVGVHPGVVPPPPPPGPITAPYAPFDATVYSSRNRWVAGALGVLLGEFGVHRFYLGHIDIGILQIVVTIVTCGIGGLWGFIEGILCFCGAMRDVDGLPLRS